MDERIRIWNLLHDGEITAMAREKDVLTLFVSIPYLRRRLPPLGDSFVLRLGRATEVACRSFGGVEESLEEMLEIGRVEIHQCDSREMPAVIDTSLGRLTLGFEDLDIATDTGGPIPFEAVEGIAIEYWREWEEQAARNREKST